MSNSKKLQPHRPTSCNSPHPNQSCPCNLSFERHCKISSKEGITAVSSRGSGVVESIQFSQSWGAHQDSFNQLSQCFFCNGDIYVSKQRHHHLRFPNRSGPVFTLFPHQWHEVICVPQLCQVSAWFFTNGRGDGEIHHVLWSWKTTSGPCLWLARFSKAWVVVVVRWWPLTEKLIKSVKNHAATILNTRIWPALGWESTRFGSTGEHFGGTTCNANTFAPFSKGSERNRSSHCSCCDKFQNKDSDSAQRARFKTLLSFGETTA